MKKLDKKFVDEFCSKCPYLKRKPIKSYTEKGMYYVDCPHELKDCPNTQKGGVVETPFIVTTNSVSSFIKR